MYDVSRSVYRLLTMPRNKLYEAVMIGIAMTQMQTTKDY